MERIHWTDVKTTLGVPLQTLRSEIFAETATLPIIDCARDRLLNQLVRLHRTAPGRHLSEKALSRPECTVAPIIQDVWAWLAKDLSQLLKSPWSRTSPWVTSSIPWHDTIPGIKRKSTVADCVIRAISESHLATAVKRPLRVFTNGSFARGSRISTAAYTIPSLRVDWCVG